MNNPANIGRSISVATFAVFVAFALGAPPPVHAAGFVVNSLADNITSGDSLCTLREAIQSANNADNGDCGTNSSANDTITFSVSGTIPLAATLPDILSGQGTLTIDGTGQNINISGNLAVRVFLLEDPGANLTLQNVRIADGRAFGSDFGGGILSQATLTLINSTVSHNNVGYDPDFSGGIVFGGGIYSEGTLTLINSTVTENNTIGNGITGPGTFGSGAGLYNAGTAIVINSTFFGNEVGAGVGAGIGNSGTLTVINSSIFDNSGGHGAGIYSAGTLTVVNSTFFNNLGFETIQNDGGTVALRNTIVATPTNLFAPNCSGTITDGGGNLQFGGGVANSCGGTITTGDPKLIGHANNGGATHTMALQVGSAAIDAGTEVTTLNGAIDSAVTTITVTDATSIPAGVGFAIQIESEQMIVTLKASNTLTVTRAANGTTAAGHNDGVGVNPAFDQRGTGFGRKVGSAVDIGAYEYGVTPTATNGSISGNVADASGTPSAGTTITLSGTQSRQTITDANGNYYFDEVETNGLYTVTPSFVNCSFTPANRSFSLLGAHTEASFTASQNGGHPNVIETTGFFVRQQYLDFLNREPDEAGFNFWVNNIEQCGADQNCREVKRINTSAAFFLSIEFQETGYLVYRMYQAGYGDIPGVPVPVQLNEFKPDTQIVGRELVVNENGWQTVLENNKQAFLTEFVGRPRFTTAYPATMSPAEFVDKLFMNAGVLPSESDRATAINEFGTEPTIADASARARALRRVAESPKLSQQTFNQAFVLMEYYGYLRRNPFDAPEQTLDFNGYNFWLNKLSTFNGDFVHAEMVKAFISSTEYRKRFGP